MSKFKVTINGNMYTVLVENMEEEQIVEKALPSRVDPKEADDTAAGAGEKAVSPGLTGGTEVAAPLSGTIYSLQVKVGEAVKEGQVLLILEALKMENEILAPSSGRISSILVNVNDVVNTGDCLITIDQS